MAKLTKNTILTAIRGSAGIVNTVARRIDKDWHTAKRYINKWEETKQAFQAENETITDLGETELIKAMQRGEAWAIKFYLTTKGKTRGYGESINVDHTSDGEKIYFNK
jgi:hypothetical protein